MDANLWSTARMQYAVAMGWFLYLITVLVMWRSWQAWSWRYWRIAPRADGRAGGVVRDLEPDRWLVARTKGSARPCPVAPARTA
jgi:hypothetical protein